MKRATYIFCDPNDPHSLIRYTVATDLSSLRTAYPGLSPVANLSSLFNKHKTNEPVERRTMLSDEGVG